MKPCLLIVDNDEKVRELLRRFLEPEGYLIQRPRAPNNR
jgi:CheY-like chemotaxis protein